MNTTLILGSASKRRQELLGRFSLPFISEVSRFDEESVPTTLSPHDYVSRIAEGKGAELHSRFQTNPILTADTTVYHEGAFFNKPKDRAEAIQMLMGFQNKGHEVWTGTSLRLGDKVFTETTKTNVVIQPLTEAQAAAYVDTFQPFDKAGGFSIQDGSGILVKAIEGDYYNVIGLPIHGVARLLTMIGIDLWSYLKR